MIFAYGVIKNLASAALLSKFSQQNEAASLYLLALRQSPATYKLLEVLVVCGLKRLASAVRFRPWPPLPPRMLRSALSNTDSCVAVSASDERDTLMGRTQTSTESAFRAAK